MSREGWIFFYRGEVPKESNNRFNTSKSNDQGSRFEGSLPQSGGVRHAGREVEFKGSLPQRGIVRRGERGQGFERSSSQSGIVRRKG